MPLVRYFESKIVQKYIIYQPGRLNFELFINEVIKKGKIIMPDGNLLNLNFLDFFIIF